MSRTLCRIFGVAFVLAGLAGFSDPNLFGLHLTPIHNVIHAFSGLFLTLHNQETGEWMSSSAKNKPIADRFFAALRDRSTFNPSESGPRPPAAKPAPGRASVYEYLDGQRGLSAFLLEQGITRSSKLGRLPTSQDRREFGAQLIRVMADVALGK